MIDEFEIATILEADINAPAIANTGDLIVCPLSMSGATKINSDEILLVLSATNISLLCYLRGKSFRVYPYDFAENIIKQL